MCVDCMGLSDMAIGVFSNLTAGQIVQCATYTAQVLIKLGEQAAAQGLTLPSTLTVEACNFL
jgi:hypothetical protein